MSEKTAAHVHPTCVGVHVCSVSEFSEIYMRARSDPYPHTAAAPVPYRPPARFFKSTRTHMSVENWRI